MLTPTLENLKAMLASMNCGMWMLYVKLAHVHIEDEACAHVAAQHQELQILIPYECHSQSMQSDLCMSISGLTSAWQASAQTQAALQRPGC